MSRLRTHHRRRLRYIERQRKQQQQHREEITQMIHNNDTVEDNVSLSTESEIEEERQRIRRRRRDAARKRAKYALKKQLVAGSTQLPPTKTKSTLGEFLNVQALKDQVVNEIKVTREAIEALKQTERKYLDYIKMLQGVLASFGATPVAKAAHAPAPSYRRPARRREATGRGATEKVIEILREAGTPMHVNELTKRLGKHGHRAQASLMATLSGALRSQKWGGQIERIAPAVYQYARGRNDQ